MCKRQREQSNTHHGMQTQSVTDTCLVTAAVQACGPAGGSSPELCGALAFARRPGASAERRRRRDRAIHRIARQGSLLQPAVGLGQVVI
jgi:hypothetical protein